MRREGNKPFLTLMEQSIMLLIFALSASICLQAFVKANNLSIHTAQLKEAVSMAQTGAELLKGSCGDLEKVSEMLKEQGYTIQKNKQWILVYNKELVMKIAGKFVKISNSNGEEVYELEVRWQEDLDEK
ncbi:hypothetical protein [Velocimicrobium porci]|uniref:Uncharacterized protein n=1 Tax=Velocimicrobium porci TaxID=2606634 RepID=A0A6L5Y0R2_9FIRM|nr:hypothetical protein [Velocimicrobium porci]MSS64716.1 hypothetical protein [Velocimicrobium porci]